jgi:hypothetical protein
MDEERQLIDAELLLLDAIKEKCDDAEYRDGCVAPLRKTAKHKLTGVLLMLYVVRRAGPVQCSVIPPSAAVVRP